MIWGKNEQEKYTVSQSSGSGSGSSFPLCQIYAWHLSKNIWAAEADYVTVSFFLFPFFFFFFAHTRGIWEGDEHRHSSFFFVCPRVCVLLLWMMPAGKGSSWRFPVVRLNSVVKAKKREKRESSATAATAKKSKWIKKKYLKNKQKLAESRVVIIFMTSWVLSLSLSPLSSSLLQCPFYYYYYLCLVLSHWLLVSHLCLLPASYPLSILDIFFKE